MNVRLTLLGATALLSACADMLPSPIFEDLDWDPPQISTSGCPDLSGRYVLKAPRGGEYNYLFLGGKPSTPGLMPDAKTYQRDKNLDVVVTVESKTDRLYVKAENARASTDVSTQYDGVKVGCSGNMLVSRWWADRSYTSVEGGGYTWYTYGERRVFLSGPDRDIHIVETQRVRCATYTSLKYSSPRGADTPLGCRSYNIPPPHVFKRILD